MDSLDIIIVGAREVVVEVPFEIIPASPFSRLTDVSIIMDR